MSSIFCIFYKSLILQLFSPMFKKAASKCCSMFWLVETACPRKDRFRGTIQFGWIVFEIALLCVPKIVPK